MKTKLLSLIAALCVATSAFAYDFKSDGLYYDITSKQPYTVAVTYKSHLYDDKYVGLVVIPETVTYGGITYAVTSIGGSAFYGCTGLTSVTIPNSVTSIGWYAFSDCTGLTSITIPNSVTSIGSDAFSDCTGLTSITIPNSVTSIGGYAFEGCTGLTSITIPNSVTSIEEEAFKGCTGLTSVTIGNSVTSIGKNAFYGCTGLTSITIPNSVTSIGRWAFSGCTGLTSVTIPNSVTSIGEGAFDYCTGLTSVTIGNSVTSIGYSAFEGCTGLTSVTIGNSVTSIGTYAFKGCTGLTSVTWNAKNCSDFDRDGWDGYEPFSESPITSFTFGNEVEYIPANLCYKMDKLTSITIPESVTSIGRWAFSGCTGLTSVTIGNSVTSIGEGAFDYCTGLTSVTIPNSVTSIEDYAFEDCTGLTSITIPNSVTSIGGYAFDGCTSLTSVTIPNSVTSIGHSAFSGCTGLTSVTWNAKNCSDFDRDWDGYEPFSESPITSFTFGNEVEYIPANLCYDMNTLTSITIPESVTSIGYEAFRGCTGLTSVTIGNSVTSIGEFAFYGCTGLTSLTIPHSVKSVGSGAFRGCSNLSELYLGVGLDSIGEGAFGGCTKLYDVYCYATNPPYGDQSDFMMFGNYNGNLHVPCESLDKYQRDAVFGSFKYILCLGADGATLPSDKVIVTSSYDNATFTWPSNGKADTYALVITKDGVVFCTLTFNANGQLMSIAFAPSKDRNNAHAPQAAQATVNGWQFTVTGLNEGSNYAYTLTVTDNRGTELQTYNGTFRTLGTTALDNVSATDDVPVRKIFRNGQVLILRGNEVYTVLGEKVE